MLEIIKKLSERIPEEVSDAWFYSELAEEVEETHPHVAQTLRQISAQEIEHMNKLHASVVALINQHEEQEEEDS